MNRTFRLAMACLASFACSLVPADRAGAEATAQPGPNAANFKLVNNGSGINQYTGSLNWKYHLLTVPGRGGLDFPIDLTYNSGIGCEQEASWVGLGFGLNLGSIERSVVYIPDELMLTHMSGSAIHQHDGWLVDDTWNDPSPADSQAIDGPDLWTVAVGDLGSNLSIVADSSNIFRSGGVAFGPAGKSDRAIDDKNFNGWMSRHQRSFGIALRIGGTNYEPDSSTVANNERQRHCYVSPPMGSTVFGRTYNFAGELKLAFNDSTSGFNDNAGQCAVYVYKRVGDTGPWLRSAAISVSSSNPGWTGTGVTVENGDRFALFCRSKRFIFENWSGASVDYDISFTDWGGYYLNPEIYTGNPNNVFHQGFVSRIECLTVATRSGTRYKFGVSDFIRATTRKGNISYEPSDDSMSLAFGYSYKLTEVLSADYVDADADGVPSSADQGSWVRVLYDPVPTRINYANKAMRAFDGQYQWFGSSPTSDSVWQWHYVHYPRFVETPTHRLELYLSSRSDNLGFYGSNSPDSLRPKKLDSLVLYARSPVGAEKVRKITFNYASTSSRPTTFDSWTDEQTLGWHVNFQRKYGSLGTTTDSTGKLTLLSVLDSSVNQGSLPPLRFDYATNPIYVEHLYFEFPDTNVDFSEFELENQSYYAPWYQENWGYYRSKRKGKPGDYQKAWSMSRIDYPSGATEHFTFESNRYKWSWDDYRAPAGVGNLWYRKQGGSLDESGVERGGIRLRQRRLDGGFGTDEPVDYSYGEGVVTKPQTPAKKAPYIGYVGNSQEVGYRSAKWRLSSDPAGQGSLMYFTNGAAVFNDYSHPAGVSPSPLVDVAEAFPDAVLAGRFVLEGVKRGLPYRTVLLDGNADTVLRVENQYSFVTKAAHNVDLPDTPPSQGIPHYPSGQARSIWVKNVRTERREFDQDGMNPVLYTTLYDYDELNGLVSAQTELLGNSVSRKTVKEYLHNQDGTLAALLTRKNMLDLVYRTEIQKDSNGVQTASRTRYDYKDFGNERVYPWHQYDYRTISPAEIETTTFVAYDAYGNVRLKIDPSGLKTSYLSGYAGSQTVLEASNADTTEVSYNGFEDGLPFDGWTADEYAAASSIAEGPGPRGNVSLSSEYKYSGDYSARVWDNSLVGIGMDGPKRTFLAGMLIPGKYYLFSGWVLCVGSQSGTGLRVFTPGGSGVDITVSPPASGLWTRVEVVFEALNQDIACCAHVGVGYPVAYFDDLRIQPVECPMQTFAYDRGTGQLQAAFDANNIAAERNYFDGFGRLASLVDPDGNTIARYSYTYSRVDAGAFNPNSPNSVKETRYRSATDSTVTVTYYDGLGREVQKQVSVSPTAKIISATVYNRAGQVAATTKPIEKNGALGSMAYETGFLPAGWTVGTAMTSGDLNSYYDADGPGSNCGGYPYSQYSYAADPLRRLKETGYPGATWKIGSSHTTQTNYLSNAASDVAGWGGRTLTKTKVIDEGGRVTYAYADRLGRTIQTQADSLDADPSRFKTLFAYDILGNRTQSIRQHSDAVTDTSTWVYNALGQQVQETTPDGGMVRTVYDLDGNTRFVMDAVRQAANQFVYYRYDALGRKVEEGTAYDVTRFTQDNANTASFPSSSYSPKFLFRYDSTGVAYGRGRLSSWADSAGNYKRCYKYDKLGRVIEEYVKLEGITNTIAYTYDWQGNLATQAISAGPVLPTVHYTYDMANRLAGVGVSGAPYRYDSLTYWPTGAVRSQAYKTTAASVCQTIDYQYNPRDWLRAINDTGTVSGLAIGTGDHFAEALGYQVSFTGDPDSVGSKLSTLPGSTELVSYDRLGRLARWHRREAGTDTTGDEIYRYDRAGNVLYWKLGATTTGFYHTYHPGTNRLKRITTNPQDAATSYQWYPNGHLWLEPTRVFQTDYRNLNNYIEINQYPPDPWSNSLTFTYDADRQRVKKAYSRGYYCACGDPEGLGAAADSTAISRWHGQDSTVPDQGTTKRSQIKSGVTPASGVPGNCVCRNLTTTMYLYTYDGRLVREYLNNATQRDFLYAGSQRIGVSEKIGAAFRLHYFITDHLGSTRSFIDSTGLVKATYNYYPFGGTRTSTVTTDTKHRYTGKELDDEDIQQYYYGARYLNGATQCFNSVDPLAAKYPGWSPYCYALANPVRNMDTKGEWVETALDVASVALSYRDFRNNPTWGNAGWLALDAVSALLPLVPAVGIIRHAGKIDEAVNLVRGVDRTADAAKLTDKTVDATKTAERTGEAAGAEKTGGRLGGPAHRGRVAERAQELEKQGHDITAGGGGPERAVRTPEGKKRFPDISTVDQNKKPYHENVGKANKDGKPISREQKALEDIERATGTKPGFTPLD